MDFVARAGAIIDRAHRVAGVLLICVIVLGVFATCQFIENRSLNSDLLERRIRYPVIVVPNAETGVYEPTQEDVLIQSFTSFVTQSLNSYTPENIQQLYTNLKPFMGPALLADSEPYFQRKIRDASADKRSSFFVPDQSQKLRVTKRNVNGIEYRDVVVVGQNNTLIGGTLAEGAPMEIQMTFQKAFASPVNPYGFLLTRYYEKLLLDPGKAPQLPTAP